MTQETARIVAELRGERCRCGSPKEARRTFCLKCYCQLPPVMKRSLYKLLGEGYLEAYAAAVGYLDDMKELGI